MRIEQLYPAQIDEILIEPRLKMKGPSKHAVKYCWHGEYGRVQYDPHSFSVSFFELNKDRILCNWDFKQDESIALMDKVRSHCLYNLMLISTSKEVISTYYEHSSEVQTHFWKIIYSILAACSDKAIIDKYNLNPAFYHFVFNIDSEILDRESATSEPRFHIHINTYNAAEINRICPIPFKAIADNKLRVEIVDPLLFIGVSVLKDAIKDLLNEEIIEYESNTQKIITKRLPVGLILKLKNGWDTINTSAFSIFISRLHERLTICFRQLREAFHGYIDPPLPWTRHKLLPYKQIKQNLQGLSWLSDASLAGLDLLSRTLKDLSGLTIARLKERPTLLSRHLAYGGLSYSVSLMSLDYSTSSAPIIDAQNVVLCLQVKLFSPHGGAGVLYMPGTPFVKISKCESNYSDEDVRIRTEFQQEIFTNVSSYLS